MSTTITAQDGTLDATTPTMLLGFAPSVESGNIVHNLIAPGEIAVTITGDYPRAGSWHLIYDDDTEAEAARELLSRPTSFALVDTDRPVVNMTFVRAGTMTPAIHDTIRSLWDFEVGFQEIIP